MKVIPDVEKDTTLEFLPEKHPVEKLCHLHLGWAKEKCPYCGSALMMHYAPTFKHGVGAPAAFPEQAHKTVFISCVMCDFTARNKDPVCIARKWPESDEEK
jgi:hypothetical protein